MLKIFLPNLTKVLPLFFIFPMISCAPQSFEDDTVYQRSKFREDEAGEVLPNPKQAAAEAKNFRVEANERDASQGRKGEDLGMAGTEVEGISDMKAAYALIMVPEAVPRRSNFAPIKGGTGQPANRRKPIFLGKLSFEATEQRLDGVPAAIRAGKRTWSMALAAKPKPEFNASDMGSYVVRPGDSLSTISVAIYGVSNRWMELAHLNRLGDGSIIFPKEIIFYVPERSKK